MDMEKKINVFPSKVDYYLWQEQSGKWKASISIGEEYYESDPYKNEDCAIAEVCGWWDGVKVQVESFLGKNLSSIKEVRRNGLVEIDKDVEPEKVILKRSTETVEEPLPFGQENNGTPLYGLYGCNPQED